MRNFRTRRLLFSPNLPAWVSAPMIAYSINISRHKFAYLRSPMFPSFANIANNVHERNNVYRTNGLCARVPGVFITMPIIIMQNHYLPLSLVHVCATFTEDTRPRAVQVVFAFHVEREKHSVFGARLRNIFPESEIRVPIGQYYATIGGRILKIKERIVNDSTFTRNDNASLREVSSPKTYAQRARSFAFYLLPLSLCSRNFYSVHW